MHGRYPRAALGILGLAALLTLALAAAPPGAYLSAEASRQALGLAGAWALGAAWRFDRQRRTWHAWTHNTPLHAVAPLGGRKAPEGLSCGKAFRWNAFYTQVLESAIHHAGALPIADDAQGGHPALHAVGAKHARPLVIPWAELTGQTGITGAPGSGKTRLLEAMACDAIRGPGCVVVIDPKGDREFMARVAWQARRMGKPFTMLTPAFPETSARMNILDTATTPAEVSTRIRALMPNAGARGTDPFFEEFPLSIVERVAQAQHLLGIPWTLEGLYGPCVLADQHTALVLRYLSHLGYAGEGSTIKKAIHWYRHAGPHDALADGLVNDVESPRDYIVKVAGSLIPTFRGVVGPPLGPLFSTIPADITWTRIVEEGMVVYVALASLLFGDIANRIGRVILQDLIGFIGHRYAYDDVTTAPPITVIIDEFGDVIYPLFINALNKGRGANARFILAQQSLADPEAALGPAQARRIMDNLNTKIWCRLADDRTAEQATDGLGTCQVRLPDNGIGLSFGGVGGLSGSSQRRFAMRDAPLIRPTWLTALPRGHAFVRMKGEVWKLQVPLLPPIPAADLDTLGLTDVWKRLDPDQAAARHTAREPLERGEPEAAYGQAPADDC